MSITTPSELKTKTSNTLQATAVKSLTSLRKRPADYDDRLACEPKPEIADGVFADELDSKLVEVYGAAPIDLSFMNNGHEVKGGKQTFFLPDFAMVDPFVSNPECRLSGANGRVLFSFQIGHRRHAGSYKVTASSFFQKLLVWADGYAKTATAIMASLFAGLVYMLWCAIDIVGPVFPAIAASTGMVLCGILGGITLILNKELFQHPAYKMSEHVIPVKFPGIIPAEIRQLVRRLKIEGYNSAFVFEAKTGTYDVKNATTKPVVNLDPLLIAWDKGNKQAYFVRAFDVTPAENQAALEFTS